MVRDISVTPKTLSQAVDRAEPLSVWSILNDHNRARSRLSERGPTLLLWTLGEQTPVKLRRKHE